VAIKHAAKIEVMPGATPIPDGWRGLLDFGEKWSEDDADPEAPEWPIPIGEPLMYGCEVNRDPTDDRRVVISLLVMQNRPSAIKQGAAFVLRDGLTARASGTLL
jgi:hypothetical protein